MSPLEGIVISYGTELVIRLCTGAKLRIPKQKALALGDTCFVLFNYTNLSIRGLWTEDEYHNLEERSNFEVKVEPTPDFEEPHEQARMSDPVSGVSL